MKSRLWRVCFIFSLANVTTIHPFSLRYIAMERISALLKTLPAGANPYEALRGYLRLQVKASPDPSFYIHLKINIAILSFGFCLCVSSLIGKYISSEPIWLIRKVSTRRGTIFSLNGSFFWTLFSASFCAISIPFQIYLIKCYRDGGSPVPWESMHGALWQV